MQNTTRWRSGVAPAVLAAFLLAIASTAAAQGAAVDFHIPSQSASSALNEFAAQAHVQLLFDYGALTRFRTRSVEGRMELTDALALLLQGTGFSFQRVNSRTIAIMPSPPARSDAKKNNRKASASAGNPPIPAHRESRPRAQTMALTEIVVSAQRVEERLVDAPVAVTAISGQMLRSTGTYSTQGLAQLVPELSFQQGQHLANTAFQIRGVGTQLFSSDLESDVAIIVDDVAIANNAQNVMGLSDIERIEVLRGPQTTLFGKDAIGGVIQVITAPPSSRLEGDFSTTFAQHDEKLFRGSISGPVTNTLGFRFAVDYDDDGGTIYNVPHERNVNGNETLGFLGQVRWAPRDDLDFTLAGNYQNAHGHCCVETFIKAVNPLLQQLLASEGITAGNDNRDDGDSVLASQTSGQTIVSLKGNLHLDAGTLSSISAYQLFDTDNLQPVAGLNIPTNNPLYLPFGLGSFPFNGGPLRVSQFSQELRFLSPQGRRFTYQAGLYYSHESVNRFFQLRLGLGQCAGASPASYGLPCPQGVILSATGFHSSSHNINFSGYSRANLRLVGGLSAIGGVRVQHVYVDYYADRPNEPMVVGDLPLLPAVTAADSITDTAATGDLGLKYQFTPDAQAYLTWSSGYKGPGYDSEVDAQSLPIKPEEARDWELGYKMLTLDGRLRFAVDAFYEKYRDLQVQATHVDPFTKQLEFISTNAGHVTSDGMELDFQARPLPSLTLSGGLTYLHAYLDTRGLQCPLNEQAGAQVISSAQQPVNECFLPSASAVNTDLNVEGGVLPDASKWSGSVVARYEHVLPGTQLSGFLQVSANARSKFNFSLNQDSETVQPGYAITNLSTGVDSLNGRYDYHVSLFVDNLLDRHYTTLMGEAVLLTSATVTPDNVVGIIPRDANRYFGATVGVSF